MCLQVRLYLRARVNGGPRLYLDPVYQESGKPQPLCAMYNGEPQKFPDGVYYLRFSVDGKPKWKAVGNKAGVAVLKKTQQEQILAGLANGLTIMEPPAEGGAKRERQVISEWHNGSPTKDTQATIETYLQDTCKYRRPRTYTAYNNALTAFRESCNKRFLHQVDRRDLMDYVDVLKKRGNGRRTVSNKVK
jgi:hypothetical protein